MSSPNENEKDRKRVLLVEDDAAVRRALQLLLSSQGYEVRAYPSGTGLSQDSEALRSDCLVADLVMPGGDAITLLRELRAAGWTGPGIVMSGRPEREWKAEALAAGFSAAFPKPLQDSVLLGCLASLTGHTLPSRDRQTG